VLEAGDLLIFVGDVTDVLDLRSRAGLVVPSEQAAVLDSAREPLYFEAVVGRESPLVGRTLKEVGGRSGYRAAAVAIHRPASGWGQARRRRAPRRRHAGAARGSDLRRARGAMQDFLVLAPLAHAVPVISRGARWVALALAVFVVCATTEVVTVLEASLLAAGIVVAFRVVTFAEAKRSIDLDVVVMIAASLGIGTAVEVSGLAADIAGFATDRLGFAGVVGVVLGILITTTILTEIVTNNAAAAVVVPIAIIAAQEVGLDYRVMAVGVAVMASSSFLTPIGYQTNAMVYGPGGYRFADFTRVGGVLNLTVLAVTTAMVVALG
jgi:di/tricarboxylate transporter